MRYLLHETLQDELSGRQKYLFDVFRMYFVPGKTESGFIPLKPIGVGAPDILFITGHNNYVEDYLKTRAKIIPERTIVITSCTGQAVKNYIIEKKEIYIPDLQPICLLRDGKPYGFEFEISDNELDLYNSSGTIMERIRLAYKLLQ